MGNATQKGVVGAGAIAGEIVVHPIVPRKAIRPPPVCGGGGDGGVKEKKYLGL